MRPRGRQETGEQDLFRSRGVGSEATSVHVNERIPPRTIQSSVRC